MQHIRHARRVILIHLATKGFDENFFRRGHAEICCAQATKCVGAREVWLGDVKLDEQLRKIVLKLRKLSVNCSLAGIDFQTLVYQPQVITLARLI